MIDKYISNPAHLKVALRKFGDKISKYLTSIDVYGDLVTKCKANPIDEVNLKIILYNAWLLKDDEHLDFTNFLDKISDAVSNQEIMENDEDDSYRCADGIYFEDIKSEVAQIVVHSDINTTRIYTNKGTNDLMTILNKIKTLKG